MTASSPDATARLKRLLRWSLLAWGVLLVVSLRHNLVWGESHLW